MHNNNLTRTRFETRDVHSETMGMLRMKRKKKEESLVMKGSSKMPISVERANVKNKRE